MTKRAVRHALSVENGCRRHPAVPLGTVCVGSHGVPPARGEQVCSFYQYFAPTGQRVIARAQPEVHSTGDCSTPARDLSTPACRHPRRRGRATQVAPVQKGPPHGCPPPADCPPPPIGTPAGGGELRRLRLCKGFRRTAVPRRGGCPTGRGWI
jgi:hypothetical protein